MKSLESDGHITIYEISEDAPVVAQYEGLEVHELVQACLGLHMHSEYPETSKPHRRNHRHVVVDLDAYDRMVRAVADLTGRLPQSLPHRLREDK
jgi:hypothetical protein